MEVTIIFLIATIHRHDGALMPFHCGNTDGASDEVHVYGGAGYEPAQTLPRESQEILTRFGGVGDVARRVSPRRDDSQSSEVVWKITARRL